MRGDGDGAEVQVPFPSEEQASSPRVEEKLAKKEKELKKSWTCLCDRERASERLNLEP